MPNITDVYIVNVLTLCPVYLSNVSVSNGNAGVFQFPTCKSKFLYLTSTGKCKHCLLKNANGHGIILITCLIYIIASLNDN